MIEEWIRGCDPPTVTQAAKDLSYLQGAPVYRHRIYKWLTGKPHIPAVKAMLELYLGIPPSYWDMPTDND